MGFLNRLIEVIIITIVFTLLYKQEAYQILNYRLILSFRNRHSHKCDLSNVCDTLETHNELVSLRNGGDTNRVEHYGKYFNEK